MGSLFLAWIWERLNGLRTTRQAPHSTSVSDFAEKKISFRWLIPDGHGLDEPILKALATSRALATVCSKSQQMFF
jgi:hypothetical protein